ncbi:MAG: hypothetical protein U9R44_00520, partial [Candidatus Omnitrophota bacterium]|nr:hypothetical protein [Candidatus Omnitrophota bacterium]
ISANVFLPGKGRSANLRARIIITVGTGWRIMKGKAVPLKAGEWTRVIARFDEFEPKEGSAGEASNIVTTENINKIAIRIERDANPWHVVRRYKGPVYIDDVIIGK